MKLLTFYSAFLLLFSHTAFTQPSQTFLGTPGKDLIEQVVRNPDGSFYAVGSKNTGQYAKVWLQKLDAGGSVVWEKTYATVGANQNGYGHNVIILANGDLILTGEERNGQIFNPGTGLAIKTDPYGNAIWKRTYADVIAIFDAVQQGNNFYFVGWVDSPGSSDAGVMMLVNDIGILQWKQLIIESNQTFVKRIYPTSDGNFVLAGRANVIGSGYHGVFLRKVKPDATTIWTSTANADFQENVFFNDDESYYNQPFGMVMAQDESFWVTNPIGYYRDITLLHYSQNGALLEQKTYGGTEFNEFPYSLTHLPDGGWLITGEAQTPTFPSDTQGFALRLTATGNEMWRRYYGAGNSKEQLFSGSYTANGSILLAGLSDNVPGGSHGGKDGWLLKVEPDGNWLPWSVQGRIVMDLNHNCVADAGEPLAIGWFVAYKDTASHLTLTDEQGLFRIPTGDGTLTIKVVAPEPSGEWTICNNDQTITSNAQNPFEDLTILASPLDENCPKTEVSMTQPDMVRCSTSVFYITVRNRGTGNSDESLLRISMDPALAIVDASEPFLTAADDYLFSIPPMGGLSEKIIAVTVQLSCDVPLGATHPIVAWLAPVDCQGNTTKPWFKVEGKCTGNEVVFSVSNQSGSGAAASTQYRVLADDLIASDYTSLALPANGNAVNLAFPADGRTWRLELEEDGGPLYRRPSATVEGCGKGLNGLASIGLRNAWRYEESSPDIVALMVSNTTGNPNKVDPAMHGFGRYNLIGDTDPIEFTARARNPLAGTAYEVEFRLSVSATFDIRTFEAVAYNAPVQVKLDNTGVLRIKMTGLQLPSGKEAMVRFRIRPIATIPADSAQFSLLSVVGTSYFNQNGPFPMVSGYLNYSKKFPLAEDIYNQYTPEVFRFGGRNYDFGTSATNAPDGSVFLAGETYSYSNNFDAWLIKTNASGEAIWLSAYDLGDQGFNTFQGVAPLPDGGCLAVGNYRPPSSTTSYLTDYFAYVARIDANGNMLWHKKFRPGGVGAWTNGIEPTGDGNYLMYGYFANDNSNEDQFYLKLDENGNQIWAKFDAIGGSAFHPERAVRTPDGGMVFMGRNSTWTDYDVYLEKIDGNGQKLWGRGLNLLRNTILNGGLVLAPDNGFVVSATAQWSAGTNYFITPYFIKISPNGDLEWEKSPVVGPFQDAYSYNLFPAPGGGYFSVGEVYTDTLNHFTDIMLLKLDDSGEVMWWKNYGSRNTEWAEAGVVSASGEVLLWGYNQSRPPLYDLQGLLVRADQNGNPIVGAVIAPELEPIAIKIFPNPAQEIVHILFENNPKTTIAWQLIDLTGRFVAKGVSGSEGFDLSVDRMVPGLYFLQFPELGGLTRRIVVF